MSRHRLRPIAAIALAAASCLDPICPRLVPQADGATETLALALPGDPEHEVADVRVPGPSRYVLRGERWLAEGAPAEVRGAAAADSPKGG